MLKMYIAVLDEAPDYMVPTLVAHSVLAAHDKFEKMDSNTRGIYFEWFDESFRKVTVRVGRKVFDKIRTTLVCHEGHENTICNGEPSCLVVLPVDSENVPKVLKYCTLWKPETITPLLPPELPKAMQVDYRSLPAYIRDPATPFLNAGVFFPCERFFKAHAALESGIYVVQPGDTLSAIGYDLGIDWQLLAELNHLKTPSLIFPGQSIRLR